MTWTLLLLAAAPGPLTVRVLEREVRDRVTLEAPRLACGAQVSAGTRVFRVGDATCPALTAEGPVTVTVRGVKRTFAGRLLASHDGRTVQLLNVVDVEDYLPSVVEAEAGGMKPAALEAQAVVSRTFALTAHRHREADLCDLAHCQVYRGTRAGPDARAAAQATSGLVLRRGEALTPAYLHAACGGHTSSALDVFGQPASGTAVRDPHCGAHPWSFSVPRAALARAFGVKPIGPAVQPVRRDAGGRLLSLRVFGRSLSAELFLSTMGRHFGWGKVRSARFEVRDAHGQVALHGVGVGHGVGLCQRGAQAMPRPAPAATTSSRTTFPKRSWARRPERPSLRRRPAPRRRHRDAQLLR